MSGFTWRFAFVVALATGLALPAPEASAKPGEARVAKPKIKFTVRPATKRVPPGLGFLPGYEPPPPNNIPYIHPGDRGGFTGPRHARYWDYWGRRNYGWGGPGFVRGRWNGGSFGPCYTWTPIGPVWNCGR